MFGKQTRDSVNESAKICSKLEPSVARTTSQQIDRSKSSASSSIRAPAAAQQVAATELHQHYLNYFTNRIPKEEVKSHRTRNSIFNSLSQPPTTFPNQQDCSQNNQRNLSSNNARNLHYQSPTSFQNQHTQQQHHNVQTTSSSSNNLSARSFRQRDDLFQISSSTSTHNRQRTQTNPSRQATNLVLSANHSRFLDHIAQSNAHKNHNHHQLDRGSDELATTSTTIREELQNDLEDVKDNELEALERNLPIELSFLIRQQAYCMARMNYLDRQIREIREASNRMDANSTPQVISSSINPNRFASTNPNNHQLTHKNGNLILSDDSGGEYSRATISDDDELSSLLDQIAKSVKPDIDTSSTSISARPQSNYSAIFSNYHPQQYTIVNPNQLHHPQQQAVPIFVMGSPFAVAHTATSINSNILPGVHFQPEPRYNQFYEGLCYQNQVPPYFPASNPTNRFPNSRSQQFDGSISTIEQLVNQKERRQIKSQLKFADNWLKMRSNTGDQLDESSLSGLCNVHGRTVSNDKPTHSASIDKSSIVAERANTTNIPTSSSLATMVTENDQVSEEKVHE